MNHGVKSWGQALQLTGPFVTLVECKGDPYILYCPFDCKPYRLALRCVAGHPVEMYRMCLTRDGIFVSYIEIRCGEFCRLKELYWSTIIRGARLVRILKQPVRLTSLVFFEIQTKSFDIDFVNANFLFQ